MKAILKSRFVWGILGFLAGVVFTNFAVITTVRSLIVRELRSPLDFSNTIQTIVTNATNRGWRVARMNELQQLVASPRDPNVPPVQVLELCHPEHTCGLVKFGRNRCVALTPCTIVVYEKDRQVYVASVNTGVIGRFFRREAAGPMRRVRRDEGEILAFLNKPSRTRLSRTPQVLH